MKTSGSDPSTMTTSSQPEPRDNQIALGTWMAVVSAFCYTASIMALRDLAVSDSIDWAILVSCLKAVPVSVIALASLTINALHGGLVWPPRRVILQLLLTGLFMQFSGNVAFQLGLSLGGMSLSVPLAYASMMISGAVLGRVLLGEPISRRSMVAISVLVLSMALLSADASSVPISATGTSREWGVATAVLAACLAGVGWGVPGVIVRRSVTGELSVSMTVFLLSVTGVFGLGFTSLFRKGMHWMIETATPELETMLLAGVLNAAAFFALSTSLKYIPIVQVNLLNASQIALASLAGVIFFSESLTAWLIAGIVLTGVGLMLTDRPQKQESASEL